MVARITDPETDESVYYDLADDSYCSVEATTDGGAALVTPTRGDIIECYEDPGDLPEEDLTPVNPQAVNNPTNYVEDYLQGHIKDDFRAQVSIRYAREMVEIVEAEEK